MKQVVQILRTGDVQVVDVPPPQLRDGGALVRTRASLISPGTERSKIELGKKNLVGKARARPELARQVIEKAKQDGLRDTYRTAMTRLATPAPLGYSASGVVLEVGSDCAGVVPGQLVACAGAGYANHAEVIFVPQNLLAPVPEGVSAAQAAYGTIGAIALHGVRRADLSVGDVVAVIGLGLVGLLTVQLVRAAGGRVLAIDLDPAMCNLAGRLGADQAVAREGHVEAIAGSLTGGRGIDAVLICAGTPSSDPIELASGLCRDRGRIVVVGAVGMDLEREPFYEKELELRLSRSYGPGRYDPTYEEQGQDYPIGYVRWTEQRNLAEFLRLVERRLVDVETLTTHRFPIEQAADAYAVIADGDARPRPVGVLLEYEDDEAKAAERTVTIAAPGNRARTGLLGVGMVGAGNFATRVLLPALAADERVSLEAVCTASGVTARHVAERFGFARATSDIELLINDPDVHAVVIATRHDTHAALAARALRLGRAVFCEKPLATTWPELEAVAAAYAASPQPLVVGFNRRFSPLVAKLRATLPPGVPRAIICRVNAGPLPPGHWLRDPVAGGGRIVGELCHFLDLACHLAGGRPLRVSAEAIGDGAALELSDSVAVQVAFADGSIASIQYLGNGDPSLPKERLEVFAGGGVGIVDDFRSLELARDGRRHTHKLRRQEKGHREELRAFVDVATGSASALATPETWFWSSALTLQVPVALGLGRPADVDLPEVLGGRGPGAPDSAEMHSD